MPSRETKQFCLDANLKGGFASRIVEGNELTSFLSKSLPIHFHTGDRNTVYLQQLAVLFVPRPEQTLWSLNY